MHALGKKSQIVSLSTFNQRKLKKLNYFDENVSSVQERPFFTLFRTLQIFVKIIYLFSLKHAHVLSTVIILDGKVFKLERFSCVT